jgi:predicted DNA repair protein MutK
VIYGLVAVIVKIDDFGLSLMKKGFERLGSTLVNAMPYMMKGLGIVGTIAMLLVGGGNPNSHFSLAGFITDEYLQNCIIGTVAGAVIVGLFELKDQIQGTSNN